MLGGRYKHEWQSSYATDCRSVYPGANPGSCSTMTPRFAFRGALLLGSYSSIGCLSHCHLPTLFIQKICLGYTQSITDFYDPGLTGRICQAGPQKSDVEIRGGHLLIRSDES